MMIGAAKITVNRGSNIEVVPPVITSIIGIAGEDIDLGDALEWDVNSGVLMRARPYRKRKVADEVWKPRNIILPGMENGEYLIYDLIKIVGTNFHSIASPTLKRSSIIKDFFENFSQLVPELLDLKVSKTLIKRIHERSSTLRRHIFFKEEPKNPFDKNAIAIFVVKLGQRNLSIDVGYFPKHISAAIAERKFQDMFLVSVIPDGRGMKVGVIFHEPLKEKEVMKKNSKIYIPKSLSQTRREMERGGFVQ